MKKKILVFLVLCNTILVANISLNKYGHINYSEETLKTEYYIENGAYYINIDGNILIGNSLFEINNGFLTLSGEHENIPTRIRIYDNAGSVQFSKEFTKVINLKTSKNGKFTIFFDGNNVQVINNSNFKLEEFFRSVDFDINNFGEAILVDDNGKIIFEDHSYLLNLSIRKVLFHNDIPLIFTEHSIFQIEQKLQKMQSFTEDIFEAKIIENTIYLVIKNNSNYKLLKFNNSKNIEQIDEINFDSSRNRIHEPIYAPLNYGEEDFPFPIGNSYAEIQQYGDTPYLHPGVDFLGDDYQEVYAVHDGFVKAIITTGGDRYWRVAIANENTAVETEGYLYAHLNENSITVAVGDTVLAGELLGTLYPWGFADFTHIHFARVFCTGLEWFGDWWTTENSLLDVINIQDTIPPIFENAILNDKFAFRTELGDYLNSINLYGEFDIIAKCHDFANSDWRIDVHDLSYSLHPNNNPDSTLFEQFSYVYDFELDTYINSNIDWMILNTIYSRDVTCFSIGDYEEREYYHIITNSNGDSLITEDDAAESFDSTHFPDNYYYFKVTARDASLNTTVDSMFVYFNNGISNSEDHQLPFTNYKLTNYPNPFNPSTTIVFSLNKEITESTDLSIYNTKGQKIKDMSLSLCHPEFIEGRGGNNYSVTWDGTDQNNQPVSSGIYFYKLRIDEENIKSKKMILLK